jgi:hypothetical protein
MNNQLLNILGEIVGVADVVGGDFPAGGTQSITLGIINGSATLPSNTPSGQNGATVLQLGNVSTNEIYSKSSELWSGSPGIMSLPTLPDSSNATDACQVLYVNHNNQNIGIAYRDVRFLTNAQMVNPGETVVFATGSKAMAKFDNNGGVTLSTQSSGGNTNYLQITPAGIYMQCDFGTFSIDQNGVNIVSGAGSKISLAGLAGAPISALSSYATISAAVVNVGGTTVNVGGGPVFLPAAMALAPAPFGTPIPMFASTPSNSVNISAV